MYGYIYITTNLINGRAYVGKKSSSVFCESYYGSGKLLHSAIKKYGKENFKIEIVSWAKTANELNKQEIDSINLYKLTHDLYNIAEGGTGGNTTLDHPDKEQIIERRAIGIKQWHDNMSIEEKENHKKKISDSKKGKSNGHAGFAHTSITKQKMKEVDKSYTQSEKWIVAHAKAAAKRRGVPATASYKPLTVNGVEYDSVKSALIALGIKYRATFYNMIKQKQIEVIYK